MKKGISLIVLIITIIVMIVIAGAIILSLNSSNVTGKASWAQISSDRANLQSEFAAILADVMANTKVDEDDYLGLTIEDVRNDDAFKTWVDKVEFTNSDFVVYGDDTDEETAPSGVHVNMELTRDEAAAFGLTVSTDTYDEGHALAGNYKVVGYDWAYVSEAAE